MVGERRETKSVGQTRSMAVARVGRREKGDAVRTDGRRQNRRGKKDGWMDGS